VIRDDWNGRRAELFDALIQNQKLWTILVTSATEAANPLPQDLKNNIANLALFIFNRTMAVMTEPAPEKLTALVNINRELAAGLRGQAPSANAA
jgi:flagellar protein FlaF